MKLMIVALTLLVATTAANSIAVAQRMNADDMKWINRCIDDNKGAKDSTGAAVPQQVVRTYCQCMNDKMDNNETQSITQWEKTHKAEMAACDTQAGWVK